MRNTKKLFTTQNIVLISMLAALSTALYMLLEVPIIPFAPHLKVNFADVPAVIGGLLISPAAAVLILLTRCVIHLLRTSTMGIGETVDFLIGLSIMLPFIFSYNKFSQKLNQKTAYITASLITVAAAVVGGIIANSILYPIFMALLGKGIESAETFMLFLLGTVVTNVVRSAVTLLVCAGFMPFMKQFKRLIKNQA